MALTRQKKEAIIAEVGQLLTDSRLTVVARYQGTPVQAMQGLRRAAAADGTSLRVVKNRLFKRALGSIDNLKNVNTTDLRGQLLYAFNSDDEVAAARSLADFAKTHPQIELIAALTAEGQLLEADLVKDLASLPTKGVLRSQLIGTIGTPLSDFIKVLNGNLRGVLNVLSARAESLVE